MDCSNNVTTWLISDLHFGHDKPFIFQRRGFNTIQEHDQKVIELFNSIVRPDDIVYCLGDIFLGDSENGMNCFGQLNGRFYLAIGNHDTPTRLGLLHQAMEFPPQEWKARIMDIQYGYIIKHKKACIHLTHYPLDTGNGESPSLVYNIHGHVHEDDSVHPEHLLRYNVAWEALGGRPIELDEVVKYLKHNGQMYREKMGLV